MTYITQYRGIRLTKTIHAASGDLPALVSDVTIENLTPNQREIWHYEYWDVNRHQALFQPLRTKRREMQEISSEYCLNKSFTQKVQWDAKAQRAAGWSLSKSPTSASLRRGRLCGRSASIADLFGGCRSFHNRRSQRSFHRSIGFLGAGRPDAARSRQAARSRFAARTRRSLPPKCDVCDAPQSFHRPQNNGLAALCVRISASYGRDASFLQRYAERETQAERQIQRFQDKLAYFLAPDAPFLSREVPWHAYNLLSSVNTLDYFKTAVTPQGSAYLYLHGFDGAPRDHALFSMPLVYLRPDLARGNLRLIMGMTRAEDGSISYSYHGNGYLENAIIHKYPSDLDIFFLASMAEYLAVTGDRAFLKEKIPFHPGIKTSLQESARRMRKTIWCWITSVAHFII